MSNPGFNNIYSLDHYLKARYNTSSIFTELDCINVMYALKYNVPFYVQKYNKKGYTCILTIGLLPTKKDNIKLFDSVHNRNKILQVLKKAPVRITEIKRINKRGFKK